MDRVEVARRRVVMGRLRSETIIERAGEILCFDAEDLASWYRTLAEVRQPGLLLDEEPG